MKRIILTLLVQLAVLSAWAQKGLSVNAIFEGDVVPKEEMKETEVRGSHLKQYKLTRFRSIAFAANDKERALVEQAVEQAVAQAVELEQERKGGHLYYAVFTLRPQGMSATQPLPDSAPKRILCYQCAQQKGGYSITLIYMEGSASLLELRKNFKKK